MHLIFLFSKYYFEQDYIQVVVYIILFKPSSKYVYIYLRKKKLVWIKFYDLQYFGWQEIEAHVPSKCKLICVSLHGTHIGDREGLRGANGELKEIASFRGLKYVKSVFSMRFKVNRKSLLLPLDKKYFVFAGETGYLLKKVNRIISGY